MEAGFLGPLKNYNEQPRNSFKTSRIFLSYFRFLYSFLSLSCHKPVLSVFSIHVVVMDQPKRPSFYLFSGTSVLDSQVLLKRILLVSLVKAVSCDYLTPRSYV